MRDTYNRNIIRPGTGSACSANKTWQIGFPFKILLNANGSKLKKGTLDGMYFNFTIYYLILITCVYNVISIL